MKRKLTTCFVASLLLSAHITTAQTGIHVSFLHYEALTPRGTLNFVFGVDKDISPKSGFAIDFNAGYGGSNMFRSLNIFTTDYGSDFEGYEPTTAVVGGRTVSLRYKSNLSSFGMTYRSLFFVSGQKNAGLYLGPFIGFRYLRNKINTELLLTDPNYYGYYSYNWINYQPAKWTSVAVPIGLRIGLRTGIPGFLGDLFFGVGYQAGNKDIKEAPYLLKKDQLSPLFMQFGFSLGGGWGGKN